MNQDRLAQAQSLMATFGESSGLTRTGTPRRYLWTDAYAVCNFLALHTDRPDSTSLEHALALVGQVHDVLGKFRPGDARQGWLSGLREPSGSQHPTAGGLRIGKALPERASHEPYDPSAEWDRDGQYFHYLTKWMHALHQVTRVTGQEVYARWAEELAITTVRAFRLPTAPARLAWKMSVDLSRPLVPSSGHHDPLDGLVTTWVLQQHDGDQALGDCVDELAAMCRAQDWTTDDALGIGGLLFDAARLLQLPPSAPVEELLRAVLGAAARGLADFAAGPTLKLAATHRLGFRELGLAIGLNGFYNINNKLSGIPRSNMNTRALAAITSMAPLAQQIEQFWLQPIHRRQASWTEHQDINDVMLASSLLAPALVLI